MAINITSSRGVYDIIQYITTYCPNTTPDDQVYEVIFSTYLMTVSPRAALGNIRDIRDVSITTSGPGDTNLPINLQ